MIRGVNKHIIEVSETENEYFERAILFVRPDMLHLNDAELRRRATKLLIGMGQPGGSLKRAGRLVMISGDHGADYEAAALLKGDANETGSGNDVQALFTAFTEGISRRRRRVITTDIPPYNIASAHDGCGMGLEE